jgi:alpha-N-acetylglucosamine transferase
MQHIPHCPVKADGNEPNSLETQKENIRFEFKQALDELKQASETSGQELFNLFYEKHPPKRGNRSTKPLMKSRFKAALLHYHPDKQYLEEDGLKWIVMPEEITNRETCRKIWQTSGAASMTANFRSSKTIL